MAYSSAHIPPTDIVQQQHQHQNLIATPRSHQHHQANYLRQKNAQLSSGSPSSIATATSTAASSKGPSAPRSSAELVRPHYRGHQRRQSVARLLPDISKLRLLSWLVEASNELINCDIAIMDGVYAKLNRSRESLLFWQQSQQQQQASIGGGISSRAPPPALPPAPPSVQPVANKTVISKRQKHQLKKNNSTSSVLANSNCLQQPGLAAASGANKFLHQNSSSNATVDHAISSTRNATSRNHHSLPLTNYDSSSLAAISMKSSLSTSTNKTTNDDDSIIGSVHSQPAATTTTTQSASDSIAASMMAMMQQNSHQQRHHQQQQQQRQRQQQFAKRGQPMGARNNCSLPIRLSGAGTSTSASSAAGHTTLTFGSIPEPADYCDDINQSDDEDDDDDSSATSSTTSSGIHGASSSAASSTSSSASSSVDSTCSIDGLSSSVPIASSVRGASVTTARNQSTGGGGCEQSTTNSTTAASSAEQLSERIRRAVMQHNYLQNLLVNVIRQHDRQRERHEQELAALKQPTSLDAYGRRSAASSTVDELPRIDLASIAETLDDGCQCSCHYSRLRYDGSLSGTPPPRPPPPSCLGASNKSIASKSSTLPTSSSLSLFQPTSLVPSRKNRRKKNSEPSREDLIQKLSDKLCENCFETHYWLHSCVEIESPADSLQQQQNQASPIGQTATDANDSKSGNNSTPTDSHDHQSRAANGPLGGSSSSSSSKATALNGNLDSIVSLRNATFIRLVQQQVRATISDSIELIDLIRREIKSPESIKQKQLMRCFSASIQLLSSVANYVVPAQDISTFIPTEMVPGGQASKFGGVNSNGGSGQQQTATSLFNLPPSDFDHILLFPHHHSTAGPGESFLSGHHHGYQAAHQTNQQHANNYHLAQAPEIPIRRRNYQQQPPRPAQRRSFDESCTQDRLQQHPRVHLLSRNGQSIGSGGGGGGSFRSLPPDVNNRNSLNVDKQLVILPESGFEQTTEGVKNSSLLSTTAGLDGAIDELSVTNTNPNGNVESSSGASSNNSSASSSIARGQVQQSSLKAQVTSSSSTLDDKKTSHDLTTFGASISQRNQHQQNHHHRGSPIHDNDDLFQSCRSKFWQSSKFNFIKKLLQVKQQRLLRQQSKDRRIYNNKVANKFRLVMMDLIHFNKSQQLLTTENGVNSLLTSMRNVLEFGLYLTVKLY